MLGGSGLVVGSGSGVSISVCSPGRDLAVVSPAAVLDFGSSMARTKVTGFRTPVVGGWGVSFGCRATVGSITLGRIIEICYQVVRMELLFFDRRLMYIAI